MYIADVAVQNTLEWQAKTQFLLAYMFYCVRWQSQVTMKTLAIQLQPIGSKVVTAVKEVESMIRDFSAIQQEIFKAHEGMARLWLATPNGIEWVTSIEPSRQVPRCATVGRPSAN
jgi:hypothetical protein